MSVQEVPQRSPLAAAWRLLRIGAHLLAGAWRVWFQFPRLDALRRQQHIRAWALDLLALLAIKLEASVPPQQHGPLLLVANHVSFIDIVVLQATCPCRFVSKADVHHWPLIGAMAASVGTVFIERESRRDAMRVVHHMAQAFGDNALLAVFPEGTTGDGRALLPFHGNLLQAAIATNTAVQPLALRYEDALTREISLAPAYVGDDSLFATLWRTLRTRNLQVRLVAGTAQHAQGRERRQWALDLRDGIAQMLVPPTGIEPVSAP